MRAKKTDTVDAALKESRFPRMTPSVSANKSLARELERLRNLSIEARIEEALTMKNRFAWLKSAPTKEEA